MEAQAILRKKIFSPTSPIPHVLLAICAGLGVFILLLIGFALVYSTFFGGVIYPGVSLAGQDVSGLTPEQAATLLTQNLTYPVSGRILFKDGQQSWLASPAELGLYLDAETSALAAYSFGRSGNPILRVSQQLDAWYGGKDLSPLMVYDERIAESYLGNLAAQLNKPTLEANLAMNGLEVIAEPGQVGRQLDVLATLAPLHESLRSLVDGEIDLVIQETPPAILDASQQAEAARKILSAPLTLHIPDAKEGDPGPWSFSPEQIAGMLTIQKATLNEGAQFQVGVDTRELRRFLEEQAPGLERTASNARFIFNDDTHKLEVIQHAEIGRSLDVETTVQLINQGLSQGEHDLPVILSYTQPQVNDEATGETLGITQLVSSYTSHFRGSSAERMQNIQTAAARFHGLLVPPGATFSMAEVMGDVSLDEGYAEALIIFGGRTIKGVGGGVCQVSTTLFRTVFFGGYPVVERYPHAYRVGYYEQTRNGWDENLAGLDATVFVPIVDFKFVNDTSSWLLMETYFSRKNQTLTWKFYSTSDGRSVDWNSSGPTNIVEPPEPLYEENPDLAPGETRQVDWAAQGADVTIYRTVTRDGQILYSDTFVTHYEPWRDIFQVGPGTEPPKKKKQG
jgi:vancomycin resistance protein YoaR